MQLLILKGAGRVSYAKKFLMSRGQNCTIERTPLVTTKVSIKRSTKASRDLGIRAGYWEGLIPLEVNLISGEIIVVKSPNKEDKYLIQNSNYDPSSGETAFFSAKCNVVARHMRYVKDVDENYNPIQEWKDVNPDKVYIDCYGEIINQKIRQEMPGLLEGTIYVFQMPKSLGLEKLDRIVYNNKNYQVVSIDSIGLDGVSMIQLSIDNRPD